MKTSPTYGELLCESAVLKGRIRRPDERIACPERLVYGSRSDRMSSRIADNQPGLFDRLFREAMDEKAMQMEQTTGEMEKEAQKRRAAAAKSPSRPSKYRHAGLEEHTTTLMPEGVNAGECDIIGKDVTRMPHRQAAKVWVGVIGRPILRNKADR